MDTSHSIGGIVRTQREKHGLTLAQLSELLNYSPTTVRQVETGIRQISLEMATRFADKLLTPPEREVFLTRVHALLHNAPLPDHSGPNTTPIRPPQGILGRESELAQVMELLRLEDTTAIDVPPVALRGMGGIGKTTLAIALGRIDGLARYYPDGVLWVQLGPTPSVRNLLDEWGRTLDVNLLAEPDDLAAARRLQGALYNRRVLLIIDDIWDVEAGRRFMLAGPRGRILLTTRERGIAYELATPDHTLNVNVLRPDDALALLRSLAPEAVDRDEAASRRLCERLEYLPLALTLAGRMLADETDVPSRMERRLAELIDDPTARLSLVQTERRPGFEDGQPLSVEAILGMSVTRLAPLDQTRFAALSVFGAEPWDFDLGAAASVWECDQAAAEATVSHFLRHGLIERRVDRYRLHALLADYAAALAVRLDL